LFGITRPDAGRVLVNGKAVEIKNPLDAMGAGICLVPEDRKSQGLVLKMSVQHNASLATLTRFRRLLGFIDGKSEVDAVKQSVNDLRIRTPSVRQIVGNLSGGNQQKVVFAKQAMANPRILILDEPTRGVDVGAKTEIHRLIGDFVKSGGAVLLISSELPEVLGISDRILVMSRGNLVQEFSAEEATQEKVLNCAL
jgi:ABC-type sugar transport system ATPase subunit